MKTMIRLLVAGGALLLAASVQAATVTVTAGDAKKFSDVRLTSTNEEDSLKVVLGELREHLELVAKRYLKEGQTLEVKFTDIDLAGEFEPWHSVRYDDVRWVRDVYVPRLKFDYKLADAEGAVIAEGSESLTDLSFQWNVSTIDRSITKYEKPMLTEWMRRLRAKG